MWRRNVVFNAEYPREISWGVFETLSMNVEGYNTGAQTGETDTGRLTGAGLLSGLRLLC